MTMLRFLLPALLALSLSLPARAAESAHAGDALWQPLPSRELASRGVDTSAGRVWRLDETAIRLRLSEADRSGSAEITLPVDGRPQRFSVTPSPIMAPELAARYPQIRTYRIRGIDDPGAGGRLSITHRGLGAMFDAGGETRYIDPDRQVDGVYRVQRRGQLAGNGGGFACGISGSGSPLTAARPAVSGVRTAGRTPGNLRIYRIAIATTAEYSDAVSQPGSTTETEIRADVLAEIIRLLNRVNQIYERDLAIQLQLVISDDLIFTGDPAADPFSNQNGELMLDENQQLIDQVIGQDNYDIGHVLSTGGGGIANVDSVCINGVKAGGVTGSPNPVGDAFYIDYVAHEIGHQFGADHSFNGTSGSCSGNRWASQAYEPGSGSTIMSYAGICGLENTSRHALAMFHGGSIGVIDSGGSLACGELATASNPNQPVVDAGPDRVIPKLTPFRLQATASDDDGDVLTYAWEQMDTGSATSSISFGKDLGDNTLFRSYEPARVATRDFPALGLTLLGKYDQAEVLPCQERTLDFRVTVRDGNSGLSRDDIRLTVAGDAGPFRVTTQATTQTLYPVNAVLLGWDTAGTQFPPVSCDAVDISLLSFNGNSDEYGETMLMTGEPNDGQAVITLPDRFAGRARFRVACSNNVFYALSTADLRIEGDVDNPFPVTGNRAFYNPDASLTVGAEPADGACVIAGSGDTGGGSSGSGGGDSGSLSPFGLIWLLGLWGLRRRFRACSAS
jgi:hypothetical protein